ncbi:MAG: glycoside hydrolase TIM-barrel-like domain-containing protein, partial [Pseudomonadota bacterium]
MATLLLQAAGATLGGFLGPVGSAVGSAIGATAGYYVDQAVFGSSRHIEGARLTGAQTMTADEGAAIARVYGYGRVSTTVIWATQFEEESTVERQGGKGGPTVTTYSYFGNVALGICEGEIAGIKRIWADGKELDLRDLEYRVHLGGEDQEPDPLIEAKQGSGNCPTYRGLAYVVFQHLPLERFGNRIPQFQVEVFRPVGELEKNIRAITIIPGATEHGLNPHSVTIKTADGATQEVNRHITFAETDWQASIDELQAICPNLEHVSLVVTWYCDDLRAGEATLRPGVTDRNGQSESDAWQVNGLTRSSSDTHVVSRIEDRAVYGGTPSDTSVIEAIKDLKSRGLQVALNPFILMDVPPNNDLPDPYTDGTQSAFPWRGRISCMPAIGRSGSADKTARSRSQIDAFLGSSSATDFGYRRMILHCAELAQLAGGVDTFLIGSEMRTLTTTRDEANAFPFVDGLIALAGDVKNILGSNTSIIYSADWSEYFGYQPQDGSGDVYFHLDPLWADRNISAIGIDYYMPLSDWRESDSDPGQFNPDGARFASDADAFENAIDAGEGFDWYYATEADRCARIRTPITDGAYNKAWTYRYKDLKSWWGNRHYNRIGGVESSTPTPWLPESKQILIMEVGCPAIQAGATQPNVFVDEKS